MDINNHTPEARLEWLSVSQFNNFVGTPARLGCEARAMAEINGLWEFKPTAATMIGSYVDAYFTDDLDAWKASLGPDDYKLIFTQKGELNASAKLAEEIIERVKRDSYFMKYLSGQKQYAVYGEIDGVKWRGKVDSLIPAIAIVDLKVVASIQEPEWCDGFGKLKYVQAGAYSRQGAVYQYLHKQMSGHNLPFFHAAVSKEKGFDIEIIHFPDEILIDALCEIKQKQQRIVKIKLGEIEPQRCEKCEYCRTTKQLKTTKSFFNI